MIRILMILALPLALVLGVSGRALAQEHPMHGDSTMMGRHEGMMGNCEGMMAQHKAMMAEHQAEMQAAQARMDSLVSAMNAATGDARVDAIAAVVNEIAAHHKHMAEMMGHGEGHGEKAEDRDR